MRVAAIQFSPEFQKPFFNLARIEALLKEAKAKGADLAVLPELCLTGYSHMSASEAEPYGLTRGDKTFDFFESLSENLDMAISWGFVEKDGTKLYNSVALTLPTGRVTTYRKQNLWGNDYLWAEPGQEASPVVEWKGKKIGLLICRDICNETENGDAIYAPGDVDVVAYSANFGDGGFPATAWMDFVRDTETALVVSNRFGQEANNNFGEGGSCVILPPRKVLCSGLTWSKECIILADIN